MTVKAPQIKLLSELLVECGLCETQRKAKNAIVRGEVMVNDLRVANSDAMLVITHAVVLKCGMHAYWIETQPRKDFNVDGTFGPDQN